MNKSAAALLLVVTTVALASTVIALKQRQELELLRVDLAASKASLADKISAPDAEKRASESEKRALAAEQQVENLRLQLRDAVAKSQATETQTRPAGGLALQSTAGTASTDPNEPASAAELERARLAGLHYSGKIQRQYGALFRQLNLSPEKIAAFTQLMVDKKQAANDLAAAASKQGDDSLSNPDDFSDLVSATRVDLDAQIKSLLGDSDYAALKAFEHTTGRSNALTQLQQSLANAGAPLTDNQVSQIDATMQKANVAHLNQKVINESKSYLSAQQIAVMQNQLQQQKAAAQLRKLPPTATPLPAKH